MTIEPAHRADWLQSLRRYLGVSIVANLVWEILQLPLYTLWATGTRKEQAFAVLHRTIGDAMIAGCCEAWKIDPLAGLKADPVAG